MLRFADIAIAITLLPMATPGLCFRHAIRHDAMTCYAMLLPPAASLRRADGCCFIVALLIIRASRHEPCRYDAAIIITIIIDKMPFICRRRFSYADTLPLMMPLL